MDPGPDRDLISRSCDGDSAAFATLIDGRIDRLYVIAQRIVRDQTTAEDAVQAAMLEAWRDLGKLRDPDRLDAWLYRLVVHACYRELRRVRRWGGGIVALTFDVASDTDHGRALEDRDSLERAFRTLTSEQRAVLVLHHVVGLPLVEVAGSLGIPEGTARSRLHYAIARLRSALGDEEAALDAVGGGAR